MKKAIVVFAKVPGKENPKSRIAAETGRKKADAIYWELLSATAAQVKGFDCFVSYTGSETPGPLKKIFPKALDFFKQTGHTLGQRVKNALLTARDQGYDKLCALGTDCPYITPKEIETAFSLLDQTQVVVGPAKDGGYYLIAIKDPCNGVFSVKGWGTEELLKETRKFLDGQGIPYALLDLKEDIDTLEAYLRYRSRVP